MLRTIFPGAGQRLAFLAMAILGVLFCALTVWSFFSGDGSRVVNQTLQGEALTSEEKKAEHMVPFEVGEKSIHGIKVYAPDLSNSWSWVRMVVLDGKDRPVLSKEVELSYYSGYEGGEHWSEGEKDKTFYVVLPKGKYKVMAYTETGGARAVTYRNPLSRSGTQVKPTRLMVSVNEGVILSRYFLVFFILFGGGAIIYYWWRKEQSAQEQAALQYQAQVDAYRDLNQDDPNQY